ncbi:MAG: hypothetical protein JNM88_09615 [Chitinophagaceae bacterium]|nr:hypothetical protein [Chitinophagaceae bacterium]
MKFLLPVFLCFILNSAMAQYYYNDLVASGETVQMMKNYLGNKVKTVTIAGYDKNGVRSTDFAEARVIKESSRTLYVSSVAEMNRSSILTRFDPQWRIVSVTDSVMHSVTNYSYDSAGRIIKIQNVVDDPDSDFNTSETHIWTYNTSTGQPEKMWRILNGTDSLEIRFIPAPENGNKPGEEVSYKKGRETDRIYYYYDDKNRLTDIVHYNKKAKKLLPDVIFYYDDNDRVIQKVGSTPGENFGRAFWVGYTIWRYIYDEKGLRTKDVLFDTEQRQAGKMEYSYTFAK